MNLSYSKLDVFRTCERRFFYQHIAKRPVPPAPQLEIGNLYHTAIERLLRHKNLQLAAALIDLPFARVAALAKEEEEELRAEVTANLMRLSALVLNRLMPIHIEKRFSAPGEAGKIDVVSANTPVTDNRGNILSMETRRCVLDWKIKFSPRNRRTQQDADDSDQLGLYAAMEDVDLAGFVEIPRAVSLPIRTYMTEFSAADRAKIRRWFDNQYAAMRSRGQDEAAYRLSERNNPLCSARWCPFHAACPGGKNGQN